MKVMKTVAFSAMMAAGITAHADYFGAMSGRSANPANNPGLSVEGSFSSGDDYENLGARVNYNFSDTLTVYGDFGRSEFGVFDGTSFGAGAFYYLPVIDGFDSAIQASFHYAPLDSDGFDVNLSALSAAFLVSPETPLNDKGLNWYANAGLTRLDIENDGFNGIGSGGFGNSFEVQIGGGVYMPLGPGTLYGGVDLIDVFIIGVGYRYGIN